MTGASIMAAGSPVRRRAWDRQLSASELQDELEGAAGCSYQITALEATHGKRTVKLRQDSLGAVTVTDMIFGTAMRADTPAERDAYSLLVSLDGRLDARYLDTNRALTAGKALVFRPGEPITSWQGAGSRQLCVTFPVPYVKQALQAQLGQQVPDQIPFEPVLDQAMPEGADWMGMLLAMNHRLSRDDSILLNPMVVLPYIESLTHGLLLSASHPYRPVLARQATYPRRAAVRIAADLMETEPARPLTVAGLAAHAHVSVRALQEGFQREFGTTPMGYLRNVRLRRAHADLVAADPSGVTVADIARRWGFPHASRFSTRYAAAFGELPNATLHRYR
jgi:AraC-like DNA-binding protein